MLFKVQRFLEINVACKRISSLTLSPLLVKSEMNYSLCDGRHFLETNKLKFVN